MKGLLPLLLLVVVVALVGQTDAISSHRKRREGDDDELKKAVMDFATKINKDEVTVEYADIKTATDGVKKFLDAGSENKKKIFNFLKTKVELGEFAKYPQDKLESFWKVISSITKAGLPPKLKINGGKATEDGEAGCRKLKILLAMYKKYIRDTRWVEKNLQKLSDADEKLVKAGASVADSFLTAIPFYSSVRDVAKSVKDVYDVSKDGGALASLIANLVQDNFLRELESNFTIISQLQCENV